MSPKKKATAEHPFEPWLEGLHPDGVEWFRASKAQIENTRGKVSPVDRVQLKRGSLYASRLARAVEGPSTVESIQKLEGLVASIEKSLRITAWTSKPTDAEGRAKLGPAAHRAGKRLEDNIYARKARELEEQRINGGEK
ncbi:MAG: hypothetical protein AAGD10_08275 [Myxococcota bacterium]